MSDTATKSYEMVSGFHVDLPALGKPRMTQSDKWKKRKCVMDYRHWCDQLREACPSPPPAEMIGTVEVQAYFKMPDSWSAKKKTRMDGEYMRSKPDGDNVLKGVCDALWGDDHRLGDQIVRRRWARTDLTCVTFSLSLEPKL